MAKESSVNKLNVKYRNEFITNCSKLLKFLTYFLAHIVKLVTNVNSYTGKKECTGSLCVFLHNVAS